MRSLTRASRSFRQAGPLHRRHTPNHSARARWGLAVVLLAMSAWVSPVALAEPNTLPDDKVQIDVPNGWGMVQLNKDEEASVYGIDGAGAPIEMYALRLDLPSLGEKGGNVHGDLMIRRFLDIEKALDLKPRGNTRLAMAGCTARSYSYKEDELEVRLVACLHPDASRAYVWRIAFAAKEADAVQAVMQRFHAFLLNHVALLDAAGSPLPREAAAAPVAPAQDTPEAP